MNIEIVYDNYTGSPYEEWDNLSKIVIQTSRWKVGGDGMDFSGCKSWDDIVSEIERVEGPLAYIGEIHGIDHSGISLWVGGPSNCPDYMWDGGQYGYLYVTRADILREYNSKRLTKKLRDKAEEIAKSEFEAFASWVSGDVWGYIITDDDGEVIDSCYGFYGRDYAEQEANEVAERIKSSQ